jgi:hypothetical protein
MLFLNNADHSDEEYVEEGALETSESDVEHNNNNNNNNEIVVIQKRKKNRNKKQANDENDLLTEPFSNKDIERKASKPKKRKTSRKSDKPKSSVNIFLVLIMFICLVSCGH